MLLPNRNGNSPAYRYGFNGMEKDDDIKGTGNSYDFGARMYDPRVGRWFSTDPLEGKYANLSPYVSFANSPTYFVDKDGNENIIYIVNVPDAEGQKLISDEDLQKQIDEINAVISKKAEEGGYELQTKVVLFNPDVIGPMKDGYRESFNKEALDDTDGVILVGEPESVKSYDRANNITTSEWGGNKPNSEGWTGGVKNPETTRPGRNRAGYVDLNTVQTEDQSFILITLHSAGHLSKTLPIVEDHVYGKDNYPNIMNSGIDLAAFRRNGGTNKEIISNEQSGNKHWKSRMIKNFGTKPAQDNYDKNNSKFIGPKNENTDKSNG